MEGQEPDWMKVQAARTRRNRSDKGLRGWSSGAQGQSRLKETSNLLNIMHSRLLCVVHHAVGGRHGGETSDSLVAIVLVRRKSSHMGELCWRIDVVTVGGDGIVHRERIKTRRWQMRRLETDREFVVKKNGRDTVGSRNT